MNPTYDFAGQVALVTGGSSGMGLATARAFAEAGAAVVIADINEATLGAATDELMAAGHRALGVRCDVSDEDSVAAMVKATVDTFGRLDMAFNNAGIQVPPSDFADEPAKVFDRVNCGRYDTRQIYFTSYVNNQTRGTRAQFLDYLGNRLSYTKPAPDKGTTSLGLRTAYVVPC